MAKPGKKPGRVRPTDVAHDGQVFRALRVRNYGERSGAEVARMLTERTDYSILRGHVIAWEHGRRPVPDAVVVAYCKMVGAPTRVFPEYTARHVTPEDVTHPLVAWALVACKRMSYEEAMTLVRRSEGIRGSYGPLVSEMLRGEGVAAPVLPKTKELVEA